jgi:pyochelin biosynthesis protein PchC
VTAGAAVARRAARRLDTWVRLLPAPAGSRGALVCFPPAGGGASLFHPWLAHLPEDVDLALVQPPGREDRNAEPPGWDAATAVARAYGALAGHGAPVAVVFGHSLGALVAARFVAAHGDALGGPRLVVSSAPPPGRAPGAGGVGPVADPPGWDGLPGDLRAVLRRRWAADLRVQAELFAAPVDLRAPIAVWGGEDDRVGGADLRAWYAVAPVAQLRLWPGDHDYPFTGAAAVVPALSRLVESRRSTPCRTPRP